MTKKLFAIWIGIFLYVVFSGLFVQKIFLPYIFPQAHWGHGLIVGGDWITFHKEAVEIANFLRENGFGNVEEAFSKSGQIMSKITGIFYAITGIYEPWVMLFYNAFLWATASIVLISLLLRLGFSFRALLLASLSFIFFPSNLTWNAQIHRDGLYILGFVSLFYSVVVLFNKKENKDFIKALFSGVIGIILIYLARQHMVLILKYLFLILIFLLFLVLIFYIVKNRKILYLDKIAIFSLFFLFSAYLTQTKTQTQTQTTIIPWEKEWWVPEKIDNMLYSLSEWRYKFIHEYFKGAVGNIDTDFVPHRASDYILYLHRALLIGLFSPFPDVWFSKGGTAGGTLVKYITPFETIIIWIGVFSFIFAFVRFYKSPSFWIIFILSLIFIYLHVISEPNLGPIYRKRYIFLLLLVSISFASVYEYFIERIKRNENTLNI